MSRLRVRLRTSLVPALLGCCLPAAFGQGSAAAPADAVGRWEAILVIRPAVSELEMVFELENDEGFWHGVMSLPTRGVIGHPLDFVVVEEDRVRFAYSYAAGGTSTFAGTLAADGSAIAGTLVERGREMPFRLERRAAVAPPEPQQVHSIETAQELQRAFNENADKTRVVLLLSPACSKCKAAARVVQRYLMDGVPDGDLAALVVWEPVQESETREAAVEAAQLVTDPRARHYWTVSPGLADALGAPLGELASPVWDLFLVYPAGARWEGSAPPPAYAMQGGDEVPGTAPFDAATLTHEVRAILSGER
jgi:hypothetical protein